LSELLAVVNLADGSWRSTESAVFQLSTMADHSGGGIEVRRELGGYGASGIELDIAMCFPAVIVRRRKGVVGLSFWRGCGLWRGTLVGMMIHKECNVIID
jgi:hypothetical protein